MWRVCSTICESNQNDFCSFCLLLEVICNTHVFSNCFVWKTCFLGVFVTYSMCKFSWELNGQILKFFNFGQSVSRLFHEQSLPAKLPAKFLLEANQQKFPDQFLKGISLVICFKLLLSSPKPLFSCLYIKTQLNLSVFHSMNIFPPLLLCFCNKAHQM